MGWIADVVPGETISSTVYGNVVRDRVVQVFDSDADRDANAHPKEGMLAWSRDAHRLAAWVNLANGWQVIIEPFHDFTPRLWIGVTEFAIDGTPAPVAKMRRFYGACQFFAAVHWGVLGPGQTGDISMLPPLQPYGAELGGFGTMYVTPMDAAAPEVGFGVFNGTTTLAGAPYPGQLAIASPKDGRLLNRDDLTDAESSLFFCFASGQIPLVPFT